MTAIRNRRLLNLTWILPVVFVGLHVSGILPEALLPIHVASLMITLTSCIGWSMVLGGTSGSVLSVFGLGMGARALLGAWALTLNGVAELRSEMALLVVGYLFIEVAMLAFTSSAQTSDAVVAT